MERRLIIYTTTLLVLLWATGSTAEADPLQLERGERAAEILASTSANLQPTVNNISTSTPMPSNETTATSTTTSAATLTTLELTSAETTTSTWTTPLLLSSEAPTTQPNVTDVPSTESLNITVNVSSVEHDADYPADYHHSDSVTSPTDDMLEETTTDKSAVTHAKTAETSSSTFSVNPPESGSNSSTGAQMKATTAFNTSSPSSSRPGGQQLLAAVGRALSQEESVPWPEAKSTKVIGTIIEDIHGPFSDGSLTSDGNNDAINNGSITAIVLCTLVILVVTVGASGYWWYRRRYQVNRPETLNDRYASSETGGAGEDIFRVGYVHSPEQNRDSSEEMYSLDNDSFLTSLEAMTIPTYWTETIKHTKL